MFGKKEKKQNIFETKVIEETKESESSGYGLYANAGDFITNVINDSREQIDKILISCGVTLEKAIEIQKILRDAEVHLRNRITFTNNIRTTLDKKDTEEENKSENQD